MTNTLPNESEMTDVFSRFSAPLPPLLPPSNKKNEISDRKKAALATAAVLLGSGAAFAAVHFDELVATLGGNVEASETAETEDVSFNPTEDIVAKADPAPVKHNQISDVQNGTISPSENIDIATAVNEGMTFGQAFAAARTEVGPGGIFSWHGEVYNTYYVEEWQGLSLGQRQEFLSEVGYRSSGQTPQDPSPDIYEFVIDGRPAIGVDDDHDGVADAVIFLDEETNDLIAYVDMRGDDRLDSVYRFDPNTEQVIGMHTIEEPFLVDVHRLAESSTTTYEPVNSSVYLAVNDEKTFEDDSFDNDDYTDESGYVNDADMLEMD